MIRTRSDIRSADRRALEPAAHFVRQIFVNGRAYNAQQKVEQNNRLKKKYLVKGRIESSKRLWDVYELDGKRPPKIIGAGFAFQEEAISFARDRSLGRETVAFSQNLRGVFSKGSGGLLIQSKAIEKPNQNVVKIQNTKSGILVG